VKGTDVAFAGSLNVVQRDWPLSALKLVAWHRTVPSRAVAHVVTAEHEFAVKADADPHPSVIGGELVQAHVARLRPNLAVEPIPSRSGALAVTTRGWRFSVTRWVDGGTPSEERDVWAQIGAALADLHSLPPVERQFAIPAEAACRELTAHPQWPTDLVSEVVRRLRGMAQAPLAVVHGQPSPANVFQEPDGSVALLDWDESGTGPAVLDVGYPLICVFLTEEKHWQAERAQAFFRSSQDNASTGLPPVRTSSPQQYFTACGRPCSPTTPHDWNAFSTRLTLRTSSLRPLRGDTRRIQMAIPVGVPSATQPRCPLEGRPTEPTCCGSTISTAMSRRRRGKFRVHVESRFVQIQIQAVAGTDILPAVAERSQAASLIRAIRVPR